MNAEVESKIEKNPSEFLLVSNTINIMTINDDNEKAKFSTLEIEKEDKCVDTNDLFDETNFDIEILKKNYLNNMISWQFLKKIADFHQWPLGCIASFIENSTKIKVETKNIYIDVKVFDKYVYRSEKFEFKEKQNTIPKINENSDISTNNEKLEII